MEQSKIKKILAILLAILFLVSLTAVVVSALQNRTTLSILGSSNFHVSSANVAPVTTATDGSTGNIGGFDSPMGHEHNMGGFVSSMDHGHNVGSFVSSMGHGHSRR
jgi:hypothetical protein